MKISCSCFPTFSKTKSTNPQIHGPATSARQRHLVSNGPPDGCEALTNPQVNVCLRSFLDSEVVIFPFTLDSYPSESILYAYTKYAKILRARSTFKSPGCLSSLEAQGVLNQGDVLQIQGTCWKQSFEALLQHHSAVKPKPPPSSAEKAAVLGPANCRFIQHLRPRCGSKHGIQG